MVEIPLILRIYIKITLFEMFVDDCFLLFLLCVKTLNADVFIYIWLNRTPFGTSGVMSYYAVFKKLQSVDLCYVSPCPYAWKRVLAEDEVTTAAEIGRGEQRQLWGWT